MLTTCTSSTLLWAKGILIYFTPFLATIPCALAGNKWLELLKKPPRRMRFSSLRDAYLEQLKEVKDLDKFRPS